jgi:hypothetical protein
LRPKSHACAFFAGVVANRILDALRGQSPLAGSGKLPLRAALKRAARELGAALMVSGSPSKVRAKESVGHSDQTGDVIAAVSASSQWTTITETPIPGFARGGQFAIGQVCPPAFTRENQRASGRVPGGPLSLVIQEKLDGFDDSPGALSFGDVTVGASSERGLDV